MPSVHKSEDQEAAEEELLSRLVALNLERQEEEKRGLVRWLRPDYQIPKLGAKVAKPTGEEQLEADVGVITLDAKPKWPSDGLAQIRIVRDLLAKAAAPEQNAQIGNAAGGRVAFFLHTDDFQGMQKSMLKAGVKFLEAPRQEPYGTVAVFEDLYGNRWDLLQPKT